MDKRRSPSLPAGIRSRLGQLLIKHPTPLSSKADRKVFLCHDSGDKPLVKRIAADLDRLGITPWIDEWEIGPGDSLFSKIGGGISEAAFFCIVLSKASTSSNWCTMELEQALTQRLLNKTKIIPLKIEPVEVPPFLGATHYLDIKRGQNRELFRLAAKMYGVSERVVATFLQEFPDPTLEMAAASLELAMMSHDIHFGSDWETLQEIFLRRGIDRSERYIIRGRDGKDRGAC